MFLLSKAILLTTLIAASSGISAYLIPLYLKNPKLNTLFLVSESLYRNQNSKEFTKKEKEKLEKLQKLFVEISSAVKDSDSLRKLLNKKMTELFEFISSSESQLSELYKERVKKLENLIKTFDRLVEDYQVKAKVESELAQTIHSQKILEQLKSNLSSWEKHFQEFISIIEKPSQESQESSTTQSQGGAVVILKAKKLRKH